MPARNTIGKSSVLEILQNSKAALSHKDLMNKLGGICDRVTVYRILDRLVLENYVHKVVDIAGVMRFAACQGCEGQHHHNHIHFSCTSCDLVTCLDGVEPKVVLPPGFVMAAAVYALSGVCSKCSTTKVE